MGMRAALTSLAAVAALAAACQGRGRDRDGARVEPPAADADGSGAGGAGSAGGPDAGSGGGGGSGSGSGSGAKAGSGAGATVEDPEAPADPSKQIAELGAISAWQAVIDRAQLLGRRGQKGVVFGRVGPAILVPPPAPAPGPTDAGTPPPPAPPPDAGLIPSPYVWLVDDTEGNGSLGIRVALGKHAGAAKEGDRIAVSGAWELDEDRRWFWRADGLQPLAAPPAPAGAGSAAGRPAADPPPAVPGHVPPTGPFPPGVKPIKQAKDGDLVYFQLVGPYPARPGDGWLVASELGDIPVALLLLPGERGSYGGIDMRTPDEHWQLRRQQTYWVRLGRIRSQGPGKPFVVQARTGPVRVL